MGDGYGISSKYLFLCIWICPSSITGIYKMEWSLLSNVALKRNSDLKKAKCMFLSGIACHSKILDKQNDGPINFISDFKSLLSFVLFLVLISFIISFMLDLNSLDCKLLKGQRVSFQLVVFTISCTSRYLQFVWCHCFYFGRREDQWKEMRKMARPLKIYGNKVFPHSCHSLKEASGGFTICPFLSWGLLNIVFVFCIISTYIENLIRHSYYLLLSVFKHILKISRQEGLVQFLLLISDS